MYGAIIIGRDKSALYMRVCWNRQTGTFEGRVSTTYGFKSHHSHQKELTERLVLFFFYTYLFLGLGPAVLHSCGSFLFINSQFIIELNEKIIYNVSSVI